MHLVFQITDGDAVKVRHYHHPRSYEPRHAPRHRDPIGYTLEVQGYRVHNPRLPGEVKLEGQLLRELVHGAEQVKLELRALQKRCHAPEVPEVLLHALLSMRVLDFDRHEAVVELPHVLRCMHSCMHGRAHSGGAIIATAPPRRRQRRRHRPCILRPRGRCLGPAAPPARRPAGAGPRRRREVDKLPDYDSIEIHPRVELP
mmetsp:Transcript_65227/g.206047  ORF Transcript_65227/g.206047 Transcript_65227/m.206047 type:complete len:201 (-) Transcript_65227:160-762(-)